MVVVTGEYGQLGNRLIVYANLIAAAREHGIRLVNPAFGPYAALFASTGRERLARRLQAACLAGAKMFRRIERRGGRIPGVRMLDIGWFGRCDVDGPEFLELAGRRGILLLKGWQFRARSSFERHAEAIRAFFRPAEEHLARANACVAELRRQADVVVGVHVRHGDYRNFQGGRFFYETERYAAWMRNLREALDGRRVAFLVVSNEPQRSETFGGLSVSFGPGEAIVDMHALAGCDFIIGPPSTFSQWASFAGSTPLCSLSSPEETPLLERFAVTTHFDETRRPALRGAMTRAAG